MKTKSCVRYTAHLDGPVTSKQAKTMTSMIQAHQHKHDRGHGDTPYDVLVENMVTSEQPSVLINAGWAGDRILEVLRKAKAEIGA